MAKKQQAAGGRQQAAKSNGTTPPANVNIEVNTDDMMTGDLRTLIRFAKMDQEGEGLSLDDADALLTLMDRVVVGGIDHIPVRDLQAITPQIVDAISGGAETAKN